MADLFDEMSPADGDQAPSPNKRMSMEVTSQGGNTAVDFLYQFEKD